MVIDLAAYRRKHAKPQVFAAQAEQELICVNWQAVRVLAVRPAAVPPLASPVLPESDEDLAAFHALAHALATQI